VSYADWRLMTAWQRKEILDRKKVEDMRTSLLLKKTEGSLKGFAAIVLGKLLGLD
jgi:hypothetical protein